VENIILTIHIILAVLLIGSVLMQKSEGGALGIGSGSDSLMSSRSAGSFLTKFTSVIAMFFIITSISLTAIHREDSKNTSVLDKIEKKEDNLPKIPKSK
jgi:preprotein translocase subunit SecG